MTVERVAEVISREDDDSALPKNQQEWFVWLSENLESFNGNLANASLLMADFVTGIDYIIETLASRSHRIRELPNPDLVITPEIAENLPPIGYNSEDHEIYVAQPFLEMASKLDMERIVTTHAFNGEVGFRGTPPDIFGLAGVEEGYHAIFAQFKDHVHQSLSGDNNSLAQYNAQEDEYRALKWQIRFAREHNMPAETTEILQEQLEQARALRSARFKYY